VRVAAGRTVGSALCNFAAVVEEGDQRGHSIAVPDSLAPGGIITVSIRRLSGLEQSKSYDRAILLRGML